MGLVIAAGVLIIVVCIGVGFAFSNWNDPKNDLHGKK